MQYKLCTANQNSGKPLIFDVITPHHVHTLLVRYAYVK